MTPCPDCNGDGQTGMALDGQPLVCKRCGGNGQAACKANVWKSTIQRHMRCRRQAARDGYCGQHHPDAVASRYERTSARRDAKRVAQETWQLGHAMAMLRHKGYTVIAPATALKRGLPL